MQIYKLNALGQPVGRPVPHWTPPPRPERIALQGRWARLEPLDPARHAAALFAANAVDREARMWTYFSYGPFDDLATYRAWLDGMAANPEILMFAVVDRESGRAVGVTAYHRVDAGNGSLEIGHVAFSPLLQRTRAATDALHLQMAHAFALGYRRVEWKCDAENFASRAAAARLGMAAEGLFRNAGVYKGRNRDTAWYSAIDADWPRIAAAFARWLDPSNFDETGRQRTRLDAALARGCMMSS